METHVSALFTIWSRLLQIMHEVVDGTPQLHVWLADGNGHDLADPTTWLSTSCDLSALPDGEFKTDLVKLHEAIGDLQTTTIWHRPPEGSAK